MKGLSIDSNYLLDFEKFNLGYEPRDLNGLSFLKSSLNHLQAYLEHVGNETDESLFPVLPLSSWALYSKFLVDQFSLDKSELNNSIQVTYQFLNWLKENSYPDLALNDIQNSIKYGQKEVDRALIIELKINEFQKNQNTPQFQDYDKNSVEMELNWLQFQNHLEEAENHQGKFEVTSKISSENKVLLNDHKRDKKIILTFPKDIFQLLQKGDHFFLRFDENSEGHQRFHHINFITPSPNLSL